MTINVRFFASLRERIGHATMIVEADGWQGVFCRGLSTKILSNGVQAALFSATWKFLEKRWFARQQQGSGRGIGQAPRRGVRGGPRRGAAGDPASSTWVAR